MDVTIRRLASLGYDGIDLRGEPDQYDIPQLKSLCEDLGVHVNSCVTIMSGQRNLIAKDATQRAESVQYVKDCIEMLHNLGGSVMVVVPGLVGSTRPNATPSEEWQFAVDSLKQCYAFAESYGIQIAIECINRFETHFVNRAEQVLALAAEVGENCGVCLDTFHMNIEEDSIYSAIRLVGDRLFSFHVADSNRMPPGQGKINWAGVLGAVREIGYEGYFSVECSPSIDRTPASPHPNALDVNPAGLKPDQRKFLEDHGSSTISEQWLTQLSSEAIQYLRKLTPIHASRASSAKQNPHNIIDVRAYWLHSPIPKAQQHVSDFGCISSFDCVLVEIETSDGQIGYGEAKSSVGSAGSCGAIVACILNDIKPQLLGVDARQINRVWEMLYNGPRDHYALKNGRSFPILGRRGLFISAMSGVDIALWDLKGKTSGLSVVDLLGGSCRDIMPAYASGGWADEDHIGEQLLGYTTHGFKAVKMRVGIMDGSPQVSARRVMAAREALGPDIKIMVDAHGTMSVPEAKRFCRLTEDADLFWFEEPCNSDNYAGTAEVRSSTATPIAMGESEFTRFDIRDALAHRAADVLQPDCAIIGGITETMRVAHLADTYQVALAPHCWGSAVSFMAGISVSFASPSAIIIEYSLGGNPMLHEMVNETISVDSEGNLSCPQGAGLGLTINQDFVKEFTQKIY